ncbi:MAG TPA: type II secretion system F family protein [Candidatus Limnocylindria bacterium]
MTVLLALAAGVVTAIASWLILRSGERDQDRIERSLGVARARAPRARISVARLADAAGVLAPEGLVASLGGFTPELGPTGRRRIRTLSAALGIAVLALVFVHPLWFVGLIAVPRVARALVEAELRADAVRARRALDREVTPAIDTFVLALEAGLPFERAVAAYAETVDTALGRELAATVRELEVGYRRREALERLVERTHSENLSALASAVRLAEDYGTPLAQALRALAIEMRATRRQRLQETALRAPVTMLLPTAGFILLPIFAIVLGPIALRVGSGSLF